MKIRPFLPVDLEPMVELSILAFAPVFASMEEVLGTEIFLRLHPDWKVEQAATWTAICADPTQDIWVADEEGVAAGYVCLDINHQAGVGQVGILAVHPAYQRRGFGSALNQFALQTFREAGLILAMVSTGGDYGNAAARRSYEKAGYTGLPRKRYYQAL